MKRFFESRASLKIASVIIAIALWLFVNSRGVSEITISVPLEIKNLAEGHEIVSQKANDVNVGLKGHERIIKSIKIQDIRVYLDMSKMKEGWGEYYINNDNIRVPSSIAVTKIDPSLIKIKVEQTISKEVPVKVRTAGRPARGFRVISVDVEPQVITIEGAKSVINRIKSLNTEDVDVTARSESFVEAVEVITNGKNVRISGGDVNATVTIKRAGK